MSSAVDSAPGVVPMPPSRPAGTHRLALGAADGSLHPALRAVPWIGAVLALTALVMIPTLGGVPSRVAEEAATTARAFSFTHLDAVAPSAAQAQPPLAWIQLGLWTRLTAAFERHELAIEATREAMVVAALVGAVLVFWVCRRCRLTRPGAAVAAAAFALTPLALVEHRLVVAENLATGWLLLSILVATGRRLRVAAPAAAVCLGLAALTAPAFLAAGLIPLWLLLRRRDRADGGSRLVLAGVVVAVVAGWLLILAVMPGPATGAARPVGDALAAWWALDPVSVVVGVVGTLVGCTDRRARPFAVITLLLAAGMLVPGLDVPPAAVVLLIPPVAISVAATAETLAVAAVRSVRRRRLARRGRGVVGLAVLLVPVAAAAIVWPDRYADVVAAGPDAAARQAQQWVVEHVPRDRRVVADDATWVGLLRAGFAPDHLIRYGAPDGRSPLVQPAAGAWRAVDYVVADDELRALAERPGPVATSLENAAEVVGSFGTGTDRVMVWRIDRGAATDTSNLPPLAQPVDPAQQRARAAVGTELAANPSLTLTDGARTALREGRVDARVLLVLAQRVADTPLTVADFPVEPGTDGADRRRVLISAVDGRPATPGTAAASELLAWTGSLTGPFTPHVVSPTSQGVLLSYSPGEPAHLLDPTLSKGN